MTTDVRPARRPKVVRTDAELECSGLGAALRVQAVDLVALHGDMSEAAFCAEMADVDLLLMCYAPVTTRVIAAAKRLRGIVKYGVGIDAIDIPAVMMRGIPMVNVPDYAEQTVAEGAFALMLALAKRLPGIGRQMQRDGWLWPEVRWLGRDIAGATVGIVGCGRIGQTLARMAGAGFRARVLGYDPNVDAVEMAHHGIEKCDDLHALLRASDFVSVHPVLNEATRGLIGPAELACLRRDAILVNSARGALIDEAALVEAAVAGRLRGLALDVCSREPLTREGHVLSPLFRRDDVILFPHRTFFTHEAMALLEADTLARCREVLEGRQVRVLSHDPRLRAQRHGVDFSTH
ncbi:MAG: hypothetical protein KGH84_04900 [Paracoccaceae bacterium]|nr:hypothetical protein [Paracoccaceae bacterium]